MHIKRLLPIVILLNLGYLVWVAPRLNGALGITLYIAEWGLFSLTLIFAIAHWERRAVREPFFPPDGTVDVFVTCYNEPLSMIRKTLKAAAEINWQQKTLYLLDDGSREELRELAGRYGAVYLSREDHAHAKAGNLNHGLQHAKSAFILTLDSDQVVEPSILQETLGHFQWDRRIAIVTTRQKFDVHEHDFNHDHMFYEHMQPGKHADLCPISCGSGVIYRRSALDEIGGFATWNVVEDLTTTYELNRRGYRSFYVDKALSVGLAPQDIKNIYKQRGTWAVDSLRILFRQNPLLVRGLTPMQRIHYLEITYQYLISALAVPALLIIPILSLLLNAPTIAAGPEYLAIRAPGLIAIIGFYWMLNRGHASNQFWAGLWPCYLRAAVLALRRKKTPYRVTIKVEEQERRITYVLPQLVVAALGILALPYNLLTYGPNDIAAVNTIWVALNAWWMYPVILKGFMKRHAHKPRIHRAIAGTAHA
jgi:cellulose synthase (UDP-forming)